MCIVADAYFRPDGDAAELGAFTAQPSFVLHGAPRVTGEVARAANAEAGLLGVAGFAEAALLGAAGGGGGGGEALPSAGATWRRGRVRRAGGAAALVVFLELW